MKIEILENNKEKIKFKMLNTKYTIPEILKKQLLENEDVILASFILEHPEDDDAIFILTVKKGKDAKKIMLKAIDELKKEFAEFEKQAIASLPKK